MSGIWSEVSGPDEAPPVVLVHGSMDRSAGLLKLSRRLDADHRVLRYDRRGYGRSIDVGPPGGIDAHAADLAALVDGRPAVVFGHSYGGDVALALAERRPDLVRAVVAYEAPMSWLPWWPSTTAGSRALAGEADPADAAERFMRRLIGDERWSRLPERTRAARRREGPAMIAELVDLRSRPAWDGERIVCPLVAMHGERGEPHHRLGVEAMRDMVLGTEVVEIAGARHFGPNTHPDEVAAVIAEVVRTAQRAR